ncbi:MAG: peptidyl-tRNA hydrolase Pth2 [Hadesarchaea archaeon]|nr:peptidyl-tRNA hydrolase Pth2 [Hadesarchaea archaeon]
MFRYKQVIVVRTDLNMSLGKLAVQVAHGAVAAAERARRERREWLDGWLAEGQKKVVVKVKGEGELSELYERARKLGLPCELIRDAGLTELPPNTMTVLAVGPAPSETVDEITGDLPLL